ncbi:DEAD/DEAH box helicase [Cytobacillus oceanisediminis]|uniref:DEAD/DEAH box helicase n=1 Tax=Cytobacillus oceanisediminis 2691 TaxID=1196031 RepID=A0A160ME77_9BACI|nr:DEAD/DEAH box helicase [Cytobacillus oceanisediminis]AND41429.1 DEAD/DEAH box helicase [Cytobacillus oceanisediminis 2691]
MNKIKAFDLLQKLESDKFVQKLIAQGDSRYILFNVHEPVEDFPNFTAGLDGRLTHIALSYLSVGCSFVENKDIEKSIFPLEKGANILEHVHNPIENRNELSTYFVLASSLAYYAAHQYSKSFILLKNVEFDTVISKIIGYFLKRDYNRLGKLISEVLISNDYKSEVVSDINDDDNANTRIYTFILSKAVASLLEFVYSGNDDWLEKCREYTNDLLDLLSIDEEPSLWWCIRLFRIIIDGFYHNSLWKTIPPTVGDDDQGIIENYIMAMAFQKSPVVELFHSQKEALSKVVNPAGAVASLPTSGGKTRVAEIAILQKLIEEPDAVIIYLTPFRSLAYEVEDTLSKVFRPLGFEVSHLYGGTQFSKIDELVINESNIIIATAEKAKAIIRSNSEIKSRIKLVIIDEGHLIGPEERYVTSEILIEELRFHIRKNEGKMVLLSAVLPNTDEIAKWIAGDGNMKAHSKWRPSTQRFGLLEYTGSNVNITWKGEIESFNRNFITPFVVKKPRSEFIFPKEKKQAVAASAVKLALSGSVLVYVGKQNMVVSQGEEIIRAMEELRLEHTWSNQFEWNAFKLACEEAYGTESKIYRFASYGVLCHHAGLPSEVRLLMEKLMRNSNPKIIVSTSTLGQGVNIGVSSVIIANVWLNQSDRVEHSDFWNIAGRAGRSFIDTEGKILFVVDASKGAKKASNDRKLAMEYFNIEKQEKAVSGLLYALRFFYRVAETSDIEFDMLLQMIAENDFSQLKEEQIDTFTMLFDLIDDTLLSLNLEFESYKEEDASAWVDDFFRSSLAYIQANHFKELEEEDILALIKARNRGVLKMVGDPINWRGFVSSSVPLRSGLFIKQELENILELLYKFQISDRSTVELISFLKEIENTIAKFPSNQFKVENELTELDLLRECWVSGKSISSFSEKALKICSTYFGFKLPWAINAIARMLSTKGLEEESKVFEELAVLVQMGLPNMFSVNIYLCGIHSRVAATELSNVLDQKLQQYSIRKLRNELIKMADTISGITERTFKWLQILKSNDTNLIKYTKRVPNFAFNNKVEIKDSTLFVKQFQDEYFLCSPDYEDIIKVQISHKLPFDVFSDDFGVYFEHTDEGQWAMQIRNPFIKHNVFDFLN